MERLVERKPDGVTFRRGSIERVFIATSLAYPACTGSQTAKVTRAEERPAAASDVAASFSYLSP